MQSARSTNDQSNSVDATLPVHVRHRATEAQLPGIAVPSPLSGAGRKYYKYK